MTARRQVDPAEDTSGIHRLRHPTRPLVATGKRAPQLLLFANV